MDKRIHRENHEFAEQDIEAHQIEFYFRTELVTPVNLDKATQLDNVQIGVEWLDIAKLKDYCIYPKVFADCIDEEGNISSNLYMGDVN